MEDIHKKEQTPKQAAALKYDATADRVPYIVGLGQGHVADAMIKNAQENAIPIVEDAGLSGALHQLGLGDDIPEDLYQVVAEILVFVARLDNHRGSRFGLDEVMKKLS